MKLEDQVRELATAVEAFKGVTDKIDALEKKSGHAPADYKEKQEKTNDAISNIELKMKEIEAAVSRSKQDSGNDIKSEREEKTRKAFDSFFRKGNDKELKALSVDSDEDGGFLVTPAMSSEIVKHVFETSPMRNYASVQAIGTDSLEILQDLDEAGAESVGEIQTRSATSTPKFKKLIIPVHEMSARPLATQKILDDAYINMEAWLAEKVGSKFARKENTDFIIGDGVSNARGILSYANGDGFEKVEQFLTAASLLISPDDLIDLEFSLKGDYRKNAVWLAKRQTIKAFRKFKDTQGRYLWEPALNG
jgi:HK97 family phage major capsid protein